MHTLALGMPGGWEWLIIGAIGLLLFGKRLPEVGRALGQGIVEFKKGVKSVETDIDEASSKPDKPASAELPESEKWSESERTIAQGERSPDASS